MSGPSKIEWTDATWNPVRGCSRISPGCENCYAERHAGRFSGPGMPFEHFARRGSQGARWTGVVQPAGDNLYAPLKWQRPRLVFVNSMSDLFHEGLLFEEIEDVFEVMRKARRHTFQVLTKRAERMREIMPRLMPEPLPNVWLGVSVENQKYADERIHHLIETPARRRFISAEPLLGPVNLFSVDNAMTLDLVITGAESGPGARPMELDWVRSLRDQCNAMRTCFFFKQAATPAGRKIPLPALDGKVWAEMPSWV